MDITLELLLIAFATSLFAGVIDAVAGGGGLTILPVLMLLGLSPAQALGTNKLQAIFGKLSSVRYFMRVGLIDFSAIKVPMICSFIGAGLGAYAVQRIPTDVLLTLVPYLIALAGLYIAFSPRLGDKELTARIGMTAYGFTTAPLVAFYDGFLGPASGSFFIISFISLLGFSLAKATAHAKLLLIASNLSALLMFVLGGQVLWRVGLVMAVGQWIGARYGSALVHHKGAKVAKPMLLAMCSLMLGKLLFS
ncbi:TSUP family transporter [Aliagarivorans marinus]|uniref:TSUP family transporter n=1 Tax=Aliagarivorans marinus TaxID=561965 RepID=UPI0004238F90|nr:TSUP family transporter [Aliagarivorans marinus]